VIGVEDALVRLNELTGYEPRRSGNGYSARCPSHDDHNPSLTITEGRNGTPVFKCHAGCSQEDVLAALGWTWSDVYGTEERGRRIVATHDYTDAEYTLLYQKVRYEPKGFSLRRPDGNGGWINDMQGVTKVLYRLPRLRRLSPGGLAVIVEGEKDVERLEREDLAIVATTNAGGAGKWNDPSYGKEFAGLEVVVIPDNEDVGHKHAAQVVASVLPYASSVKLLELPGVKSGGDVSDWLTAGNTIGDLYELVDATEKVTEPPPASGPTPGGLTTLADLLASKDQDYDWLIPGLIERGDRFMLTGAEGGGKSTLLRQIGVAVGAGLHPFTSLPIGPLRVLLVDCENSRRQITREFHRVLAVGALAGGRKERATQSVFVACRSEGLVLDGIHDLDGDRAWLELTIEAAQPELVILGPLYKLIGGDPTEEPPSRELAKFIDSLRGSYGFAVMLEAHTPHTQKRPYGWSGWKRWPEFGLHLDPGGEVSRWRGDREERHWPEQMRRGNRTEWPWVPGIPVGAPVASSAWDKHLDEVRPDVLKVLRLAKKPLDRDAIVERTGRQRRAVLAVLTRLQDSGGAHVTQGPPGPNGKPTELFQIDPRLTAP
jgi:hypothetical protein